MLKAALVDRYTLENMLLLHGHARLAEVWIALSTRVGTTSLMEFVDEHGRVFKAS